MTSRLSAVLATAASAAVAFGALALVNRSPDRAPAVPAFAPAGATDARIRTLEADVRARPSASGLSAVGLAYLERARRVGGAQLYPSAQRVLDAALERQPDNVDALTGMANLTLARHDFAGGLRWAQRARRAQPDLVRAYPPLVDAYVELGRYTEAERELQRLSDLRPGVASYSRVSYLRELRGDLDGAAAAMRLAISAAGESPDTASLLTLLGGIELQRGRPRAAERAYRAVLVRSPGDASAQVGLARVAQAGGRDAEALRRLRAAVSPDSAWFELLALADAERAAGHTAAAQRALRDMRRAFAGLRAGGENTDTERALVEAEHGDPRLAVRLARRGHAAAPSVRAADALGYALTRAGRPREGLTWSRHAVRLGWREPGALYRAGTTAAAAGDNAAARRWLTRSLEFNPRFSPLHAPRARAALERLQGVTDGSLFTPRRPRRA